MNLQEFIEGQEEIDIAHPLPEIELTESEQMHLFMIGSMFKKDPVFKAVMCQIIRTYQIAFLTERMCEFTQDVDSLFEKYEAV